MATTSESLAVGLIRRISSDVRLKDHSDHALLQQFLNENDESAFEVILQRHGPMVLNVCRSVLGNTADADDAFQATFVVLVRKSGAISKTLSVAGWLHQVAYRTALKARGVIARRHRREPTVPMSAACEPDQLVWAEVQTILHEELSQLAERYRQPLVLCYLQGKTQAEAAALLRMSKGTIRRRLERARTILRERLARRGLGPAASLFIAAWPTASGLAFVPDALSTATVKSASCAATGVVSSVMPAAVRTLAEGVMKSMFNTKLKTAAVLFLSAVCLVSTIVVSRGDSSSAGDAKPTSALPTIRPQMERLQLPRVEMTAAPVPAQKKPEQILFWLDEKPILLKPDGSVIPSKDLIPAEHLPNAGYAHLSPSGSHIAFLKWIVYSNPRILYVLELDGTKQLTKLEGINVNTHHWMGSGDKLYIGGQSINEKKEVSEKYEQWVYE